MVVQPGWGFHRSGLARQQPIDSTDQGGRGRNSKDDLARPAVWQRGTTEQGRTAVGLGIYFPPAQPAERKAAVLRGWQFVKGVCVRVRSSRYFPGSRSMLQALRRFFRPTSQSDPDNTKVIEIALSRDYRFMYENFLIATQHDIYLLMEKHDDVVHVLYFDSAKMKYGSPNDEARGGHPLAKHGLGFYGFFQVENSPWIREQMIANRVHERHFDGMFDDRNHYVVCFKDVMLEVTCRSYEERSLSVCEVDALVHRELEFLEEK